MSRAEAMAVRVTEFLEEVGGLPAYKDITEAEEQAIADIQAQLQEAQVGLESAFIQALRDRKKLPQNDKERQSLLRAIFTPIMEKFREVIASGNIVGAGIGRSIMFQELLEQGLNFSFTDFSEKVLSNIWEKAYKFSEGTVASITGNFRETLAGAYEDGIGIDDTVQRLKSDFASLRDSHVSTIARTEIQSSQNLGADETMRELGVQYKQWITARDSRVRGTDPSDRYDHVVLHGEVNENDQQFSNGLAYPGDRTGSEPGQVINCRCRVRPYIPGEDEFILSTPYHP